MGARRIPGPTQPPLPPPHTAARARSRRRVRDRLRPHPQGAAERRAAPALPRGRGRRPPDGPRADARHPRRREPRRDRRRRRPGDRPGPPGDRGCLPARRRGLAELAPLGADDRERLATHELTHAALAPTTSGRTPAWLLEGIALWTSGDRRGADAADLLAGRQVAGATAAQTAAARRVLDLRGLARPDAIGRLSGLRQAAAYAYASAAAFHVAGRYGRRRLLALYDAFNDERLTGRPGPALDDRAVRRTLHVSLARLDRDLHDALTAP